MSEDVFVKNDVVIAGCGETIKKSEGFVCPYFCRKADWNKHHKGYGPCGVDIQVGTNVCLYGLDFDTMKPDKE